MADNINNPNNNETEYQTPEEAYTKSQQSPAVANKPGKNFIFLAIFIVIVGTLVYFIFGGSGDDNTEDTGRAKLVPPKPLAIDSSQLAVPPLPPAPTPPPAPIDTAETPEDNEIEITPEEKEQAKRRMQSEMLVSKGSGLFGGGLGPDSNRPGADASLTAINDNDPNVGFADSFYNQKDTPFATARRLGDTGRLITQGKIIDAILETPINTDVPGMIRAVVSRDIYAESGRAILVPKGSRLVGTYNSFVIRGNKRVNVIWSRVIRPDGIDIMIRSAGADQLGVAGLEGNVDNKYLEIFSSAFLVSAINIAMGAATDAIDPDRYQETTNTDGSTTRQTSATQEAGLKAVDLFGQAGENLIGGFLNLKPTITIDQGTRISVFVNRDLVFPAGLGSTVQMIQ